MPDELGIAEIQQAFLEYRTNFKQPAADFWYRGRQGELIEALHDALSHWHVGLENITWNQNAKNASEVQLTFGVPSLVAGIQVGMGAITMNAFNPDWSRAPQLVSLFQAGLDAVVGIIGQTIEIQHTTLGLHVKPGATPLRDSLVQFVNPRALGSEDATMFGVSAYYDDHAFVIDGSGVFPGSVFIKLVRNFPSEKRFEEMAKVILADEEQILKLVGMRLR